MAAGQRRQSRGGNYKCGGHEHTYCMWTGGSIKTSKAWLLPSHRALFVAGPHGLSARDRGGSAGVPNGGSGSVLSHTVAVTHTSRVHLYKQTKGGERLQWRHRKSCVPRPWVQIKEPTYRFSNLLVLNMLQSV